MNKEAFDVGQAYLDAAFKSGDLLNQVWSLYSGAILAVLAGLIFSKDARAAQPIGRVLLVLAGMAIFFAINFVSLASQSERMDTLLRAAKKAFLASGAELPPAPRTSFFEPWLGPALGGDLFEFQWEPTMIAHIVIDFAVLVTTALILLSGPKEKARQD